MSNLTYEINPKQDAIRLFGASSAPMAILTLETFMEMCSVQEIPGLIPYIQHKVYPEHKQRTIGHLINLGYDEDESYDVYMDAWRDLIDENYVKNTKVVRIGYKPVNLGTAFHDGKLYYPIQTLIQKTNYGLDGRMHTTEKIDVVVVRSDRTMLYLEESVDENGNPSGIIRLTDGTLLEKRPAASPHASWSWDSIQEYLEGSSPDVELDVLVRKVHQHLRSRVWLPASTDYWLLAFAAVTSYVQAIFDAIPLILLNGKGGTGKSELGAAMTEVSCNAVMIGQSSAPTIMRLMDSARGLVVIDDLESIGVSRKGAQEKFSEMVQVLKTSYKKSSATKIVTNVRKKTEVMNFYGVKIVSNTAGVDDILGSRMLHISTSKMPKTEVEPFLEREGVASDELSGLRNALHIWAFEHADEVYDAYLKQVAGSSQRDEEIAAPLKAIAALAGIPEATSALNDSLGAQQVRKHSHASPEDALYSIVDAMIMEGARRISLIEISLSLREALGAPVGKKSDYPVWMKPEWISKKLRSKGYTEGEGGRKNLHGYQMRLIDVSEERKKDLQVFSLEERDPYGFCSGCGQCRFRLLRCDIMPRRLSREGI